MTNPFIKSCVKLSPLKLIQLSYLLVFGILNSSKGDLSGKALPVHSEITSQTIEGVLESSGLIFLEEEVADPSASISTEGHVPKLGIFTCEQGVQEDQHHEGSSEEVELSVDHVGVL